jgi:hypothetical protein
MDLDRRASFLLPLSLLGCSKTRSPESVSNEFIDRYYIERNYAKALEVVEEGAAQRVRSEKQLVEEAGGGAYGVQPRVFYKKAGESPREDGTELTYDLTIDSSGVQLKKEVRLVVKKLGADFKVTFFHESDVGRP